MSAVRSRIRRPAPVSDNLQQLGDRIRQARTEAGLSQAQLGAPHFTRAYVSAIELGKARPAMKSLEFLADKLGRPMTFFVEDEEVERRRRERTSQLARANQLIAEGKPREAIDLLEPLVRTAGAPTQRAELQRALGRALRESGRSGPAAATLSEAIQVFKAIGNKDQLARARGELGACLVQQMSYTEAEVELEQALVAISKGDLVDAVAKVHVMYNLGVCAFGRGDFKVALERLERAEREGADIGDPKWLGSLFAAIGMSRHEIGDYESAISYLRRSETLFESINNRLRGSEIKFLTALSMRALGHKLKGAELFEEALASARASGHSHLSIRIAIALALGLAEDGELEKAVLEAEQVVVEADQSGEDALRAAARFALGRVLRGSDRQRAEQVLRESVAFVERLPTDSLYAEIFGELSEVLAENGVSEEALTYSRRAYQATKHSAGGYLG